MNKANKHSAADPLVQQAYKKLYDHGKNKDNEKNAGSHAVLQYTVMTIVPFTVYVIMLFITAGLFYMFPVNVFLAYTIIAGTSILQFLVITHCLRQKSGGKRWRRWVGFTCFFAATAALVVGLLIHYKYSLFYYKYKHMMTYTNVAASQPASQFEDAGSLLFTSGTKVDTTRAVGYRNIRDQTTLCVAPVVDSQMTATEPVVFFAVGVGCCGWRASFHCDNAKTKGAEGGVLMLEPSKLVSPVMEWMVDEQFDFKGFDNAIELQKSVFATTVAKDYRLLRWVKDPAATIDVYRKRGLEACFLSFLVYFMMALAFIAKDAYDKEMKHRKAVDEATLTDLSKQGA